ncbi:MAG: acetyl-CoA hydrolase/transferase C-terminal domain-containing protein [Oscillospiraceae bacterium]|nr:acetyl-CoA hydrolase/transferase C-terminal domain-containing protein [Oscillospiraceae bacterium]
MIPWTPIRKGRMAGQGGWQEQYRALRMTPAGAAALVRDGDTVVMTSSANWPYAVDGALAERLRAIRGHVELDALFAPLDTALLSAENTDLVDYNANFFSGERKLMEHGNVRFVPTHLSATGAWMASRKPRVAIITCSAPDENGWMSRSLWGAQVHRRVLEQAEVVIVEVNDQLPSFASDGEAHMMFHVSEADAIVENSHFPAENPPAPADETDRRIAGYIADLVPDGACVQFGLGGLANAVGECLADAGKKDLGIQSEVLSNCVVTLMEKGVINNSRKQTCPGRSVGAYFVGDKALWDFARDNPAFSFKEIDWVNDPRNIARNDRVVSVNNAMEIDLTGQVNAESVGPRQYSGTGGQLEWVLGAQWSREGKSIIALRSSYRDKQGTLHSKIVPQMAPGSIITTPRTCVQYVVTEYGVADLRYKSTLERAKALIAIAHPDFREELKKYL